MFNNGNLNTYSNNGISSNPNRIQHCNNQQNSYYSNKNSNHIIINNGVLNLSLNQNSNKGLSKVLNQNSFGSFKMGEVGNSNSNAHSVGNNSNNNLSFNQILSGHNREKEREKEKYSNNNEIFEIYLDENESFSNKICDNFSIKKDNLDNLNSINKVKIISQVNCHSGKSKDRESADNKNPNENSLVNDFNSSEPIKNITFNSTFKKHSIDTDKDDIYFNNSSDKIADEEYLGIKHPEKLSSLNNYKDEESIFSGNKQLLEYNINLDSNPNDNMDTNTFNLTELLLSNKFIDSNNSKAKNLIFNEVEIYNSDKNEMNFNNVNYLNSDNLSYKNIFKENKSSTKKGIGSINNNDNAHNKNVIKSNLNKSEDSSLSYGNNTNVKYYKDKKMKSSILINPEKIRKIKDDSQLKDNNHGNIIQGVIIFLL